MIYYTTFPVLSTPFFIFLRTLETGRWTRVKCRWKQDAGWRWNADENRTLAEGGMQSIWHASHPAPPASASIAVIRGQLASLAHAALWQHGRHRAPCGCPAMLRVDLLSTSCQLFFANSPPAKPIVWGEGSCVAKRWELQLRVFCIYKRPVL